MLDEKMRQSSQTMDASLTVDNHQDHLSGSDETSTNNTCNSNVHKRKSKKKRRTPGAVHCLRWMLAIVLVCSTITIATLVYLVQSDTEHREFETQLDSDATKLLSSIGRNFAMTLAAAELFMYRIMLQSRLSDDGATWPMVTIPGLAVQAAKLMSQTNSIYMTFYPLIHSQEDRKTWENYTKHHDEWVEEALRVQASDPNFHGPILTNYSKSSSIWRNEGPEPEDAPGPFLPSWMGSPVIPYYYPYNWNALAYPAFAEGLTHCLHDKLAVVTPVANNANPNDPVSVAQAKVTSDWAIPYLSKDEQDEQHAKEPFSDLYYPVLPAIDEVVFEDDPQNRNQSALGAVAFSFYWRHSLKDILPSQSKGLVLVVSNPCRGGQSFTYQVNGAQPVFLGFGDLHERQFDRYARSHRTLAELTEYNKGKYTGRPMNVNFCPYTITVYPSSSMAQDYITNAPILLALGSALIFVFVATLFCAYDWLIRREFHTKQRLLEIKRHLMMFVSQEVQRPLHAVCQGLVALQDEMEDAVPAIIADADSSNMMHQHFLHNYLLDDYNVAQRSQYLQQQDADHLRSHLEGWLHMTKRICDSAESSVDVLGDLLAYDDIIQATKPSKGCSPCCSKEGGLALKLTVQCLWKLIAETAQEFLYSARSKNIQYSLENHLLNTTVGPPGGDDGDADLEDPETKLDSLKIVGDHKRLTQLLRNLLSNAIKVSPPSGRISVRVSWVPISSTLETTTIHDKHVLELGEEVTLKRIGTAHIEVRDNGEGLAESQLEMLRDDKAELITADKFETEKMKDIGLLISKRVALQHGGDLNASSSGDDDGTTFTVKLPLYHVPDYTQRLPPIPCPVGGELKVPNTMRENRRE